MDKENNIYGIRAVIEAIQAGQNIDKVFIQSDAQGNLMQELLKLLKQKQIQFSYVPIHKLNRLTDKNHQGVVATVSPVGFVDLEQLVENIIASNPTPLFLILDGISDARNFGAIIRTAVCCGVNGIIISKTGAAPVNADTIKTSAGGIFNIPICKVAHIKDAIFYLQSCQISTLGATEKAHTDIYDAELNTALAIVMGSEDKGINPSVLKILDKTAKLPIYSNISSLNVSVACGAILYEVLRQRR